MINRLRKYQNTIWTKEENTPKTNVKNFVKEPLSNNLSLPKTLTYEDIDKSFKEWVESSLHIDFEGKEVPTMALFTMQRFSEYMQNWSHVDENKNMLMNFKVLTRESNPKPGTLMNGNMNIPGEPLFLMRKVLMTDENGRPYFLEYKRKQPMCVDLVYTVTIVTNKYSFLNEFNMMVLDKFKAIQDYIFPNGYALPMTLEDVSDESEYNINDRQFFSQSFDINVEAFIIRDTDYVVEECPMPKVVCYGMEGKSNSASVEIEVTDIPGSEKKEIELTITFKPSEREVRFKINTDFECSEYELENIWDTFKIKVNDTPINELTSVNEGDEIFVYSVKRIKDAENGKIVFKGTN